MTIEKTRVPREQYETVKEFGMPEDLANLEPMDTTPVAQAEVTPPTPAPTEVVEAVETPEPTPAETAEAETNDGEQVDTPAEGAEQSLPGELKTRFVGGEWKFVATVDGKEELLSPKEFNRRVQSNAAITRGFQENAKREAELNRIKAEIEAERANLNDLRQFFPPTDPTPAPKDAFDFGDEVKKPVAGVPDKSVLELVKKIERLEQNINAITGANRMVEEGRQEVAKSVDFAKTLGVNVPEDLTALNHAVATDAGGIGNERFWQLAKDPRYMVTKMRDIYGTTVAPAAPPRSSVSRPPVAPQTPKPAQKKLTVDIEIERLQKERAIALKNTENSSGREAANWGVKSQDLYVQIETLKEKRKKG